MPRAPITNSSRHEGTQGLIFCIDSCDHERIDEAAETLSRLLNDEYLKDAALLVFCNKQDAPGAMPVAEITNRLGLLSLKRKWYAQGSCAIRGDGLLEGLDWLSNNVKKQTTKS